MIIYFIETTNITPHLETSLELAKIHLEKGDEVHYYFIGHSVDFTEFLITERGVILPRCLPERKGFSLLDSPNFHYYSPSSNDLKLSIDLPKFKDIDKLKNYRYKNYNVGLSTLSSLIQITAWSKPDLEKYDQEILKIMSSGISVYEFCRKIMKKRKPDLLYLFNGRFANNRAILDAAIEMDVDYMIHERGSDDTCYFAKPYMPHDFLKIQKDMLLDWQASNRSTSEMIAINFFEVRLKRGDNASNTFVQNQEKGMVMDSFQPGQKLITYFTSSDDEFAAVGDIVKWDRWPDQLTAVKDLISIVDKHPSITLAIRIHPHMVEKYIGDLKLWLELELPQNVGLIKPTDKIDSYAQIESSDLVITSGSTVGIESVYMGTPSVCMGPSLYSQLDAVYLPQDNSELETLILSETLVANPEKALPYGYYMATFGEKYVYYEQKTGWRGEFMGVDLQAFGICAILRRIKPAIYKAWLLLLDLIRKLRLSSKNQFQS